MTLILLISSFILLLKLHHRDVARNTIDYFKRSTQSASSTLKEKEKQIKLEEKNDYVKKKNSVKHWHKEIRRTTKRKDEVMKDVSDFPEKTAT